MHTAVYAVPSGVMAAAIPEADDLHRVLVGVVTALIIGAVHWAIKRGARKYAPRLLDSDPPPRGKDEY
jgi:hypothetical protein